MEQYKSKEMGGTRMKIKKNDPMNIACEENISITSDQKWTS